MIEEIIILAMCVTIGFMVMDISSYIIRDIKKDKREKEQK